MSRQTKAEFVEELRRNRQKARRILRERVKRGAAVLDKKRPAWFKHIDLDSLDMPSGDHCIIGQAVVGVVNQRIKGDNPFARIGYFEGIQRVLGKGRTAEDQAHGFNYEPGDDLSLDSLLGGDSYEAWDILGDLWAREVRARREAAA